MVASDNEPASAAEYEAEPTGADARSSPTDAARGEDSAATPKPSLTPKPSPAASPAPPTAIRPDVSGLPLIARILAFVSFNLAQRDRAIWRVRARSLFVTWLALWAIVTFVNFAQSTTLRVYDPYFHIREGVTLRDEGALNPRDGEPHAQYSIWRTHWADKEWLYHVVTAAFTLGWEDTGDAAYIDFETEARAFEQGESVGALSMPFKGTDTLEKRGKFAAAFWTALLLFSIVCVLRYNGFRSTGFLVIAVLLGGSMLWMRLSVLRPHVVSVTILIWVWHCCLHRKTAWVAILAAVYVLAYSAGHAVVVFVCVVAVAMRLAGQRKVWPLPLAALGGFVIGFLAHPNLWGYLHVFLVQNVVVPANTYMQPLVDVAPWLFDWLPERVRELIGDPAMSDGIAKPAELAAGSDRDRLNALWTLWLPYPFTLLLLLRGRIRLSPTTITLLALSLAWGVLYLSAVRFLELFGPFTILFYLFAMRDYVRQTPWRQRFLDHPRRTTVFVMSTLLMLMSLVAVGGVDALKLSDDDGVRARQIRDPLRLLANRPAADQHATVFTPDWSDYVFAVHYNPRDYYITGLDPMFMVADDPHRAQLWQQVVAGQVEIDDPLAPTESKMRDFADVIRRDFNSRFVLLHANYQRLLDNIVARPAQFRLLWGQIPSKPAIVYRMTPEHWPRDEPPPGYLLFELVAGGAPQTAPR